MLTYNRFIKGAVVVATLALSFNTAHAGVVKVFEFNAETAADLQPTVDEFREALGDNNGNNPVNADPNGRRQINWDAAPDFISDPNAFPGNFFNFNAAPRARGIEFEATGKTTGFKLSANPGSGTDPFFGNGADFNPFSDFRMFAPVGGNTFDVNFFDPATQINPATTRGLGVVFNDVEDYGASTKMSFFDLNNELLFSRDVLSGKSGGLSFLGVVFDEAEVTKVSITAGNISPFGTLYEGNGYDAVVMDDFIFSEPTPVAPVPLPAAFWMLLASLLGLGRLRRKAV